MAQNRDNIKLTDIQGELNRLWDSLESSNKIRACLFNLIVYTHDNQRIEYFQSLVRLVIEKLPCRIIFVKGQTNGDGDYLHTNVSAETSHVGNSVIACDLITIESAGAHLERVPFIILPNIVPDLPVYLLWGHNPNEDDHILPTLQKFATRLIFDSECITDLPTFSRNLLQRMEVFQPEVADMNWARTRGWRDAISQIFNTEEKVRTLTHAKRVQIVFNHRETSAFHHCDTQALFIQGWLAAQLNWKLQSFERSEGNRRITYNSGGREVIVILSPGLADQHSPGTLLSFEVDGSNGEHVKCERQPDSKLVRVQESTAEQCAVPYKLLLSRLAVNQSLMNEVLYENLGNHYQNMLKLLASVPIE